MDQGYAALPERVPAESIQKAMQHVFKVLRVRIFAYSMLNCVPHHEEYAFSLYVGLYLRNVNRYSVSCSGAAGNRIDNGLVIQNFACRNRCWAAGLHRIQKRTNLLNKREIKNLYESWNQDKFSICEIKVLGDLFS